MEVRSSARWVRDKTIIGDVLRTPWRALRGLGVRLPRTLYQHLGSRGIFSVSIPGGGQFRWRSYGHVVENCVYWDGLQGYEPESVEPWVALARRARVVLDIGANTGYFALLAAAASEGAAVYAFEPVSRVAAKLRANAELNPNLKIEIVEKAVGAETGLAPIFDPGGVHCYSASLDGAFLKGEKESYSVSVVRVDDFLSERGVRNVDLVKLDVEGLEDSALDGMQELLRTSRPALMIEVLQRSKDRLLQQLQELVSAGYGYYLLNHGSMVRLERVERAGRARNVLLCPPERLCDEIKARISVSRAS
ncbi:MAG: FkbM family methyltransferase [Deltaproteobacteria bacterium]|nr:FkbM family methyltransferase [Deltaproteobacteria bacterium]